MFKSLWFKLSVFFTLLTLFYSILANVFPILLLGHDEYNRIITPERILKEVIEEEFVIAKAIKSSEASPWLLRARSNLNKRINSISKIENAFHIHYFSEPKVFIQLYDINGQLVYSDADSLSSDIKKQLSSIQFVIENKTFRARRLSNDGYIEVTKEVFDENQQVQGYIIFLLAAPYDPLKLIKLIYRDYYIENGLFSLMVFSFFGLICGLCTTWLVTRRLREINRVILVWREGNLIPRITINRFYDDTLTEHSKHLNAMADDLASLFNLKQQMAVTEERNRVARELHDTVKQNLFALNLQLAAIRHKCESFKAKEHIDEAEKITREAQLELMEILTQLRPVSGDENHFYERITTLIEDIRKRFQVEIIWQKKDILPISPVQEHTLVRIAQEAISNAIRHGKATQIIMNLYHQDNIAYWSIEDNGEGMLAAHSQGLGLVSMQERSKMLPNGQLFIHSVPQQGVSVRVQWRID